MLFIQYDTQTKKVMGSALQNEPDPTKLAENILVLPVEKKLLDQYAAYESVQIAPPAKFFDQDGKLRTAPAQFEDVFKEYQIPEGVLDGLVSAKLVETTSFIDDYLTSGLDDYLLSLVDGDTKRGRTLTLITSFLVNLEGGDATKAKTDRISNLFQLFLSSVDLTTVDKAKFSELDQLFEKHNLPFNVSKLL